MMEQMLLPFSHPALTRKKLCYSRYFSCLQNALSEHIATVKMEDPLKPVVIVVPSGIAGIHLRRAFTGGGLVFLNFKQLSEKIGKEYLNSKGLREIPSLGENISARKAVKEVITPESPLYPFIKSRGLLLIFLSLLKDLRQGGFDGAASVDELVSKMEKAGGGIIDGARLRTVFRLLGRYREGFRQKYFDVEDIIRQASEMCESFTSVTGADSLAVYGFDTLDQAQKTLLRELSQTVNTAVFLPVQPGNPVSEGMLSFFRETGFEFNGLENTGSKEETAIFRAKDALFEEKIFQTEASDDGSLLIFSCGGPVQEADETARHILKLASQGVPFDDMAVVFKNSRYYLNIFRDRFNRLGIPVFLHQGSPLDSGSCGRTLLLLMELAHRNLPRFDVMELFTSGNIDFSVLQSGESRPAPARWEIISRKAGIREGLGQWQRRLRNYKSALLKRYEIAGLENSPHEEVTRQAEEIESLLEAVQKLNRLLSGIPRKDSWRSFAGAVSGICKSLLTDDGSLGAVLDVLETMGGLDRLDSPVSLAVFRTFLKERLENASLKEGAFGNGCVGFYCGGLPPGLTPDNLFLPGMLSGNYPAPIAENPLMRDREREIFNRISDGKSRIVLRQDLEHREELLFSLMVRSAGKRLILLYPRNGMESGEQGVPSSYLLEIAAILKGRRVFFDELTEVPCFRMVLKKSNEAASPADSLDLCEYFAVASRLSSIDKHEMLCDMALVDNSFKKALIQHYRRWQTPFFTAWDGVIADEPLRERLVPLLNDFLNEASASSFEKYHTCPYSFFLWRILQLSILESPEETREISPKDRGSLYHEIFRSFYSSLKAGGLLPLKRENISEYLRRMEETALFEFGRIDEGGMTGARSSWFEKTVEMKKGLEMFIENELACDKDRFVPDRFEFAFGMKDEEGSGNLPPAKMTLSDSMSMKFRGRIDRLDIDGDSGALGIIDYKTGRAKYERESLAGGKQLQLPIYLYSLIQLMEDWVKDEENSWACYYYATPKGDFKRHYFTGSQLKEKKEAIDTLLSAVVEGTKNGIFIPFPGKAATDRDGGAAFENCQFCDYKAMCPVEMGLLYSIKENDPVIRFFKESKEIK